MVEVSMVGGGFEVLVRGPVGLRSWQVVGSCLTERGFLRELSGAIFRAEAVREAEVGGECQDCLLASERGECLLASEGDWFLRTRG